jgi:hypothetical protein
VARQLTWRNLEQRILYACQVGSPRGRDAIVERGHDARLRLRHDADPAIRDCVAAEDLRRGIARAVIDDDELEILKGLGADAADRLVEKRLPVVDRHDDADRRRGHNPTMLQPGPSGETALDWLPTPCAG